MAPVRSYSSWNVRASDSEAVIEPYRKYFFICEGANTETWYFKKLIDLRKQLGIKQIIDIRLLEKTGEDKDISYPRRLIEFADEQKTNPELSFDYEHDKMIVVFDVDIFENKVTDYAELISYGQQKNILAVTNPSFELFLLLHFENSYETEIVPNTDEIIRNEKKGNQRFIYSLLLKQTGINSKKNAQIGDLAEKVDIAIQQEKKLNQDILNCHGIITSNIGCIIQMIRDDTEKR